MSQLLLNRDVNRLDPFHDAGYRSLSREGMRAACEEIRSWPGYSATPLRSLDREARHLGLRKILYKDESNRFGLGSFKALGGSYALLRAIQREHLPGTTTSDLFRGRWPANAQAPTVTCATDGNHGLAVAWAAQTFGCPCVVFMPSHAPEERAAPIRSVGAEVVRIDGDYEDAVEQAAALGEGDDWLLVADTEHTPRGQVSVDVMHGYTVLVEEVIRQLKEEVTHIFVQAGVGGLAASVVARFWAGDGPRRPITTVVEPARAACLKEAAQAGRRVRLPGPLETTMDSLACGRASATAWNVIQDGVDAFLTVEDEISRFATDLLGTGPEQVTTRPSGAAGLAGLLVAATTPPIRRKLQLTSSSVVLLIGTEGAESIPGLT